MTFRGGALEEAEDALLLRLRDHRAHLDVLALGRISDLEDSTAGTSSSRLVVDLRARNDPRGCGAVGRVEVAGDLDALGDRGGIGVVETTTSALPPSSEWTRFSVSAAFFAMSRPVEMSPVRETIAASGCLTMPARRPAHRHR